MSKVLNIGFAGKEVTFSCGSISFDENGVGEITDEEIYKGVIKLPNFTPVVEPVVEPVTLTATEPTTAKQVTEQVKAKLVAHASIKTKR